MARKRSGQGMITIEWETDPMSMVTAFDVYEKNAREALFRLMQYYAGLIETWMKQNHKWDDRTGNLTQSLYAEAEQLVHGAGIVFGHNMEYSVFIELANQGVWGILPEALDYWGPRIWQSVKELFG
jgi:hypothetical protein